MKMDGVSLLGTHTNTTQELIMLIEFLKDQLASHEPYKISCFKTQMLHNRLETITIQESYYKVFKDTDIFIIPICCKKIHEVVCNKSCKVWENQKTKIQDDEEIEEDILKIQEMLYPKKILILSDYNFKQNGEYEQSRDELIQCLHKICTKHNIPFIDPTITLAHLSQEDLYNEFGYTDVGLRQISNFIRDFINKQMLLCVCVSEDGL